MLHCYLGMSGVLVGAGPVLGEVLGSKKTVAHAAVVAEQATVPLYAANQDE
ncbi:hypothetical protein [Acetobacter orientalis]|uniref:hypothetical protein n=1 Tax=Acetobacter orientalis TaxID=146474 RepID=UPI0015C516C6|nr:hypothetical protein [Acetobacter orientalis]